MEKDNNVSKDVSNSNEDYDILLDAILKLKQGTPSFNNRVAKRIVEASKKPNSKVWDKPVNIKYAKFLVSKAITKNEKLRRRDWRVLSAMDEELEEIKKMKERMAKKLLVPSIRYQKAD